MTKDEALKWLMRLYTSKNHLVKQMAYNRLRELLTLLLPES